MALRQLLPEALVFNVHALHRNLHLAADSPDGLCVANAKMIALPVEIKLTHYRKSCKFCQLP
jgi:hypothetical protein